MEQHELTQGSPAWLAYRAAHRNASDAPAMMGVSPYKTRNQLLHEVYTGMAPDIDAATQARFDDGHRFEALARERAEELVGESLYPVVGSLGILSASFDGLTICDDVVWEHKTLNDEIRSARTGADLGVHYRIQVEQQLLVADAGKCLFMATKWDRNGNLVEERHFWLEPDPKLRTEIVAGWEQFDIDLAAYKPEVIVELPKAAPVKDLPVVTVQVRGELSMCNLDGIKPLFDEFLAGEQREFKTDDDFGVAEEQAKKGRAAAKQCKMTAKAVVDQMLTIAQVTNSLEEYAAKFDAMGLRLEKAVKEKKEERRAAAKVERDRAYTEHINAINAELHPLRLTLADADKPQFVEVMKNQRMLSSLYNKLDTELARCKIAADAAAKEIRSKRTWYATAAAGVEHLFADLGSIICKQSDDFQLVVTSRIEAHKAAEKAKADALRAQIAEQERIKAEAAAAETVRLAKVESDRVAAEAAAAECNRVAADTKRQLDEQAAALAVKHAAAPAVPVTPPPSAQPELARQASFYQEPTPRATRPVLNPAKAWPAARPVLDLLDTITDAGPTDGEIIAFGVEHDMEVDELIPRLERFIADARAGALAHAA